MKKLIALLLALMISLGVCYAETTPVPDGAEVIVIFAQQDDGRDSCFYSFFDRHTVPLLPDHIF